MCRKELPVKRFTLSSQIGIGVHDVPHVDLADSMAGNTWYLSAASASHAGTSTEIDGTSGCGIGYMY